MSNGVTEEVMARAEEIYRDANNFNSMTWHGPLRDELREVVDYVWRAAHEAGHGKGYDDGYDEGVKHGGCDYCR